MKKRAIITVTSKQTKNDDDVVESVTPGYFYRKSDIYYAVYKETKISGMDGTTTILKISDKKLLLIRIGKTTAKMEFEENRENVSMYNTSYGTIELKIDTIKYESEVTGDGGNVTIDYRISAADQSPQYTKLFINIKVQ
ncbi:DUF1934 domain-containing protein [Clostridium fermenticellae]|uniref:DUF1934 domain-containing protein n=1 Tax=Clostridium fermenticellae TaxID=2068654 RepID=A0A386H0I0_9CLOT|nr:DUF1934 domain-containing protein [Clostridium fermenticellae]AYD39181.1 DUF1934 domain-containing protein [Clostridium fermenticellae]